MKILLPALTALALGCATYGATPPEVIPFPYDSRYTEVYADQGVVDLQCYRPGGRNDQGYYQSWNGEYGGCVDGRVVWIARGSRMGRRRTELHEYCHIRTGSSSEARKKCDEEFH